MPTKKPPDKRKSPRASKSTPSKVTKAKPKRSSKLKIRPIEDLHEIARGMYRGEIFTDRHIRPGTVELTLVFMPLGFLDQKAIDRMKADKIDMLYAYNKDAAPRAINGYPMFMSMGMLNRDESKIVMDEYRRIVEAVEGKAETTEDKKGK